MNFRYKPIRTIALSAIALLATACPQDRPLKNGIVTIDETTTTAVQETNNFSTPTYKVNGGSLPAVSEEDLQNFVVKCFSREKGNENSVEISVSPEGVFSVLSNDLDENNFPLVNLTFDDGRVEPFGDVLPGTVYGFSGDGLHTIEIVFPNKNEAVKISLPASGVYMIQDSIRGTPIVRMKIYPTTNRVVGYETWDGVPFVMRTLIDIDGTLIPAAFSDEKGGNMISIAPRDANRHGFTDQVVTVDDTLGERTCAVSHTQGLDF